VNELVCIYGGVMTIDEIKERATKESLQYNTQYSEDFDLKKFIDNSDKGPQIDRLFRLLREKAYRDGYIAGAKDNTPQWHYPSNGELPEEVKLLLLKIPGCYVLGWYRDKVWYFDRNYNFDCYENKIECDVIAWQDFSEMSWDTK